MSEAAHLELPMTDTTLGLQVAHLRELLDVRFSASQRAIEVGLDAQSKAVAAALAASDRAVTKAELASEKRFEGVNEFRAALDDRQRTLMPRMEAQVLIDGLSQRLLALEKRMEALYAERAGVRGGYGYAAGIAGLVLTLASLAVLVTRALQP